MVIIDDKRKARLLNRLRLSGLSVASASDLIGLGRSKGYHMKIKKDINIKKKRTASIKMLDKAEELLLKGYPIDLVARLTGVSASRLLYFLEDLDEG